MFTSFVHACSLHSFSINNLLYLAISLSTDLMHTDCLLATLASLIAESSTSSSFVIAISSLSNSSSSAWCSRNSANSEYLLFPWYPPLIGPLLSILVPFRYNTSNPPSTLEMLSFSSTTIDLPNTCAINVEYSGL
eukprot:NODE_345_length_10548_cov_0.306728.p8 type:complete len:135 gc:universal NODE_345_length_10548_cov_0.306728:5643-5239(-)